MAESKSVSMLLKINTIANLAGFKQLQGSMGVISNQVNLLKTSFLKFAGVGAAVALGFEGLKGIGNFMKGMKVEATEARHAEEKLAIALQKRGAAMNVKDIPKATAELYKLAEGMERVGLTSATSLKEGFAGLVAAGFSPDSINKMKEGFEGMVVATQGIGASKEAVKGLVEQLRGMIGTKGRIPADWKQKGLVNQQDIDKYSKLKTETQKAAWVQGILAKQGNKVKEMLGTTEAKRWQAEQGWKSLQETLGKPFLDTQIAFTNALGGLARALTPVTDRLAALFTPAMEKFAAWIEQQAPHIEWFGQVLDEFAEGLIGVFAGTHEINWDFLTKGLEGIDWMGMARTAIDMFSTHIKDSIHRMAGFHLTIMEWIQGVDWGQVGTAIGHGLGHAVVFAVKSIGAIGTAIGELIIGVDWGLYLQDLGKIFTTHIPKALEGLAVGMITAMFGPEWLVGLAKAEQDLIREVKTWPNKIGEALSMIKDMFTKAFQDAFNAVLAAAGSFVSSLGSKIVGGVGGFLKNIGNVATGKGWNAEQKQLGGLVAHPTFAALAEKGPEVVVPMQRTKRNVGILGQAAAGLGLGHGMGGGGGPMNVNVSIPITVGSVANGHEREVGSEIARAIQNPIKEMLAQLRKARDEERRTAYI